MPQHVNTVSSLGQMMCSLTQLCIWIRSRYLRIGAQLVCALPAELHHDCGGFDYVDKLSDLFCTVLGYMRSAHQVDLRVHSTHQMCSCRE